MAFHDWRNKSARGPARVINLDTGQEIPFVRWCDDETGEYERLLVNDQGAFYVVRDDEGNSRVAAERGRARIRVEFGVND